MITVLISFLKFYIKEIVLSNVSSSSVNLCAYKPIFNLKSYYSLPLISKAFLISVID